ncbi:cytochrome P460 family protein [Acidisoma sp. L85]|uniref:cytochrome P460 family protein n=1 Tax=Acidisoma sp. L85 TaxID=1641850 RepID=UPI001C206238|nr:cytochrome P460 family protein [Acidisoma sp. L85]
MKRPGKAKPFSRLTFVIATMSLVSLSSSWQAARTAELGVNQSDAVVDSSGYLKVPADYRKIYQYLGSWAIAASQGQGSDQLHNVYASPGTIDNYRATGRFPDGAVLVKEVFGTSTAPMTTGIVSHAQTLKGWFVMVKDSKNSRLGNKLWGDGWGWSWFGASNPSKTTTADYKVACQGCHIPAQASDWIYVAGYPVLKR